MKIQVGQREVTPPEVSAIVLRALKERAEAHSASPSKRPSSRCPRTSTTVSGRPRRTPGASRGSTSSGSSTSPRRRSPTGSSASARAWSRLRPGRRDVRHLDSEVKDGVFEVLATNGNTRLGGDDFDHEIVLWLLEDIRAKHDVYLGRDPERCRSSARRRGGQDPPLRRRADHVDDPVRRLHVSPGDHADRAGAAHRAAGRLHARPCRMALADAGLSPADIDEVVLVGGSTRIPLVRRQVGELFGKTPHSQLNPTRSSRWARPCRLTSWRAASRTCSCWT